MLLLIYLFTSYITHQVIVFVEIHHPSVACPCSMFERIFYTQFGHLADFHLVIWRIFIWSFGKFSFGHLASSPINLRLFYLNKKVFILVFV